MPPPVPTTPGGSPAGIATTLRDAPERAVRARPHKAHQVRPPGRGGRPVPGRGRR